jgi:hypothetical protein
MVADEMQKNQKRRGRGVSIAFHLRSSAKSAGNKKSAGQFAQAGNLHWSDDYPQNFTSQFHFKLLIYWLPTLKESNENILDNFLLLPDH